MLKIEHYHYMKMEPKPDHRYDSGRPYWCLDYYKNNMSVYNINGDVIDIEPNSLYIAPPNVPTIHRSVNNKPWTHTAITFYADREYIDKFSIPYMTPIYISNPNTLEQLMFDMQNQNLSQTDFKWEAITSYLKIIIIYIHDMLYVKPKDYYVNIGDDLQTVKHIIMNSTHMHWTIESMASLANMSPRSFLRKYKEIYGRTPIADLYEFRFIRSKRLLEDGYSINYIIKTSGFKSAQHFCDFFKRHSGMSPSQYRNKIK